MDDRISQIRGAANLKIEWVPPPYIPSIDPRKSGDQEPLPKLDLSKYPLLFKESEELKTASPEVKRLLSLEFTPREKAVQVVKKEILEKVQRHPLDTGSMESIITCLTVRIRSLQEHMAKNNSRDVPSKVFLKEAIEYRQKLLKHLRRMDYRRFEWLLEKLNLLRFSRTHCKITRIDSLQRLTKIHSTSVREKRLEAYKKELKNQQAAFLKEKEEALKWIEEEEKALGLRK
nr:EOG090X09BQ [Eulimnadia texana]